MEEEGEELAGAGWAGGAAGAGVADSSGVAGWAVEVQAVAELTVLSEGGS